MAPKIRVPANFGIEHINSEVHGNLVLKLKDGQQIKTNSMIMSLNSPVIDNLTTNMFQVFILICYLLGNKGYGITFFNDLLPILLLSIFNFLLILYSVNVWIFFLSRVACWQPWCFLTKF